MIPTYFDEESHRDTVRLAPVQQRYPTMFVFWDFQDNLI
jgi:hypothetical protein